MEVATSTLLIYPVIGSVAGLLAGLLGIGGGIVVVPTLAWSFTAIGFPPASTMQLVVGTSLATIVVTASASTLAHHRRDAVIWRAFAGMAPGLLLGAAGAGPIARSLRSATICLIFGVFLVLVGIYLLGGRQPAGHRRLPSGPLLGPVGLVIAGLSSLLGVGGGTLLVPFLLWSSVPVRQAVATSAACTLPIAVSGAVSFIWAGWRVHGLPSGSLGYLYAPAFVGIACTSAATAQLGARLAHSLATQSIKRIFGLLLVAVGLKMAW